MARTGSESGSIATSQSRAALILNEIGYVASLPVGHYPTNGHRAVTGQHWLDEEDTADNSKDNSKCLIRWWAHQDSNLKPRDYESPALTVEL